MTYFRVNLAHVPVCYYKNIWNALCMFLCARLESKDVDIRMEKYHLNMFTI